MIAITLEQVQPSVFNSFLKKDASIKDFLSNLLSKTFYRNSIHHIKVFNVSLIISTRYNRRISRVMKAKRTILI